jgi:predicted AAA+ superfamily ATPase
MLITSGPDSIAQDLQIDTLSDRPRNVVFDELHKYRHWRDFLKGFFDVYSEDARVVVTGSARLGFFRRGGDSLMGRYFLYRMHPLSVAELNRTEIGEGEIGPPVRTPGETIPQLMRYGGFPEPFLKSSNSFYNRWRRLRNELLFREDMRDLTRIQEVGQIEVLAQLLASNAGQLISYSSLASGARVAVDTVRRWIGALEALFYCFTVRPWFKSVPKSLRKQPKVYLWDWSLLDDGAAQRENFVASHLLKAVHWWTDIGLGSFGLYYLRDKAKREVDFLVVRNGNPWFLAEVKSTARGGISPALPYYASKIGTEHAFQIAFDLAYVDRDCFHTPHPLIVPASTFLSQLV